jgi:2Fe-2S ferredoxin
MVKITYVAHDGAERVVSAEPGLSLMEVARINNIVGIDGDCGGACACGTCQIRVEPVWIGKLKEKAPDEEAMLEYAERSGPASRLSCQVTITEEMDGLVVHMPRNQH